jgi:hypothetical protein
MLLTFEGYFNEGRFITDTLYIPEGKKTIVTVLDEAVNMDKEKESENYKAYWNKIIEDIQNSNEVLEGKPEHIHFKTPQEIDSL